MKNIFRFITLIIGTFVILSALIGILILLTPIIAVLAAIGITVIGIFLILFAISLIISLFWFLARNENKTLGITKSYSIKQGKTIK